MYIITVSHTSQNTHRQVKAMAEKIGHFVKFMSRDDTGPQVHAVALGDEIANGEQPAPAGADVYVVIRKLKESDHV
jgi:hypothetical protein